MYQLQINDLIVEQGHQGRKNGPVFRYFYKVVKVDEQYAYATASHRHNGRSLRSRLFLFPRGFSEDFRLLYQRGKLRFWYSIVPANKDFGKYFVDGGKKFQYSVDSKLDTL